MIKTTRKNNVTKVDNLKEINKFLNTYNLVNNYISICSLILTNGPY